MREFSRFYRRAAADLARERAEGTDPHSVYYLNQLVGRAHSLIYRTRRGEFYSIARFYRYEFPEAVRRAWPYVLSAFGIFLAAGIASFLVTYADEEFSAIVAPGMQAQISARKNWTEAIAGFSALAASGIMTNNIMVTFLAFALGITAGVGTFWVLAFNGLMLGSIVSLCVKYRFSPILIFVTAHGVLELSAIFIAGGAGLMIGHALIAPGRLTRRDALADQSRRAVRLVMGCIPLLVLAGLIEGFLSPAPVSAVIKFIVAGLSGMALMLYIMKPPHPESSTR
ncbi:MAG: stage II sporulation protein M [Acidobacteria bacterium]|nr:stage II sporulation protein M [Acidobacteriota bacterium]